MMGFPTGFKMGNTANASGAPKVEDMGLNVQQAAPTIGASALGGTPVNAGRRPAPIPGAQPPVPTGPAPTRQAPNIPPQQPTTAPTTSMPAWMMNEVADKAGFTQNMRDQLLAQTTRQGAQMQQQYAGTPYGFADGYTYYRPGGDPNAPWASGQANAMAGVDQRVQTNVYNPNAYQYGGQAGMAQREQDRYGGLAEAARFGQAQGDQQYQQALGQYGQGMGMSDQARASQVQGMGYLQNMAEGRGPSAAQAQMAQGLNAAREQQASFAANARGGGGNLAAAQAGAASNAANIGIQGIQGTAALRAQEQANAMNAYGQAANDLRASDFGRAQLSAGQQGLAFGQQQFGANQATQYESMVQAIRAQQAGYQQSAEQQNLAREAAERGWNLSQQQVDNANTNSWIQGGLGAGAAVLGALVPAAAPAVAVGAGALANAAKKK